MGKGLTFKQQLFVDNYDGNATEAARKAGYVGTDNTLRNVGCVNLTKPNIQEAIENRQEKDRSKLNATRQEKEELLTEIMRNNSAIIITGEEDKPKRIDIEVAMKDRLKAVELHSKINGEFINKHEHSGKDGGPIKTKNENISRPATKDELESALDLLNKEC